MFHPNIAVRNHVVTLDVPFRVVEEVVYTNVERIKAVAQLVFATISNVFHKVVSFITGSNRVVKPSVATGSYKVSCSKVARPLDNANPYIILALDGGGVRGKASLAALKIIEQEIGTNLVKAVDCIAGVSTGGIIAAALATPSANDPTAPRYTAADVDGLYDTFAEQVFSTSLVHKVTSLWGAIKSKYSSPRAVMESVVGDMPLSTSIAKKLIITSLDLITGKMVFFENGKQSDTEFLKAKKISCFNVSEGATFMDALEATSAAPTYFPSSQFGPYNLTDGGVADNNPAQLATLLAMNAEAANRPILVISIGTGKAKHENITTTQSVNWGILQWVSPLIDYFLDSKEEQADLEMNLLAQGDPRINYVRFQMTLENDAEAQMDNASPDNMKRLEELGTRCFTDFLNKGGRERIIAPLKQKLQQLR